MDKLMIKAREIKTKKGYHYKCSYCGCPYGDYAVSQAGTTTNCGCGKTLMVASHDNE